MARLGPTGLTQVFTDIKNWVNSKLSTKADTAHTHTTYAVKHAYTTAASAAKNWYRIANANTKQVYTGNPIHAEFILTAYNSSYDPGYSERWYVRAMVLGRNAHVIIFGGNTAPFSQCRVLYENTLANIDDNDRPAIDIYLNYVLANGTTKIEIEEVYNQGWTFVANGQLAVSTVPTGFENVAVSIRGNGVERSTYSDIATYLNKPRRDITSNVTLADNTTYRSTTLNCTGTRTITLPSINSNYFWCVIKNFNTEAGIITIHPSTTSVLIDGSNDDIVLRPGEFVTIHSRAANSYSIVGDNRKRTCLVGRSGVVGTDTKHWFRVAQKTIRTTYRDAFILFDVFQVASDSSYMGRLCAHVRVDNTIGVVGNKQFNWLYRGTQLSDDDFAMTTIETSGTSVVVDIWCKRAASYGAFAFAIVSEGFSTDSLDSPYGKWILTRERATVGDLESLDTGFTTVTNPSVVTLANSITGNAGSATTAQQVRKDPAAGSTADLLYSQCAGTDIFRLQVGGASNAGYAEIATADDGSEPIYVRQYKGTFTSLQRTATLLDGSGNTSFPGQVTGVTFNGPLTWNGDTLSYTANHSLYFYSGQPAIANCFEGSSNDFTKFSYPAGSTTVSTIANIQTLRLDWGNTYWHDIFVSPNNNYLWHRNVVNSDARGWRRIVEENVTGLTDQSWNINIAGTATNVTGTVAIANGGTGATTRLNAVKALTNEAVGTPTHFLAITTNWGKAGYTTVAQAKTVLGITGDMGSHSDSEYVHKTGNETISGDKTFGNGTLIVDNGTGSNVHGEIKLDGTRPVYINADNSDDGLFANTACGMSILLNDASKSIHIGGVTTGANGRKIIKTSEKVPYLTLGTQEVGTQILVPENDTADSTFSITSTLKYASGAAAKSFTVKFKQGDDGSSGVFPVANNKTDLGLSGNRWKNVYATNYYYGADAVEFSTKFVTTDTAQTITGVKTFANSKVIVGRNTDVGSAIQLINSDVVGDSANGSSGFEVYGSSISDDNKIGGLTVGEYSNNGGAYATIEVNRTVSGVKTTTAIRSLIRSDGSKEFSPSTDNDIKLGHSSFRWSAIYGNTYYYGSNNVEFSTKFVTTDTDQSISGSKIFNGDKIVITQGNGYRMVCNTDGGASGYGVFQRVDGSSWYLMVTAQNNALGSWTSARPASMNLSTGVLSINGNAATATEFSANKSVTLTGDVTGTASSKAGWSVATTLSNSGVTAGTYGPSADVTGNNNATISVPEITVDAKGRVTAVTNRTYTSVNTDNDKRVHQYYKTDDNVYRLLWCYDAGNTSTSTLSSKYTAMNNAFYVNPSTGSLYATKLYSGGVEVLTAHQSLANYVTLNTAQEITNTKTFKDANTVVKRTDIEAGNTLPSADKLARNIFQDKNGKELGSIYYYKNPSGNTGLCLRAGDWFTSNEGVYSLNASGTNRRAELHLYSDSSGNCCIKPVGYFSATLKALSTSVWLGESTKPFGRVYANAFEFCNAGLLPDTDVQTTEEHSIGFFGQNNTPLSYITFQKRPNLKDRVAIRIQTSSSAYKSYDFDATCFYPESSNSVDIGSTTNIFKNIYCNNYYKGTTAFGDIVTHNASEFLTSHQSLSNYVTLDGTQTIAGTKTFSSTISGSISGNAGTATQFSANTTVALTGDATGTSAGSKKGWSVPVTLANSGVTAGSYGPATAASPAHGGTFSVPYVTVDAKGRVTAASTVTITLPADSNTDTKVTQTVTNDNACYPLLIANTASASHTGLEPTTETDEVRKAYNINVQARYGFIYARNSYNNDNLKGSVAGGNRTSAAFYGSTYDGAIVGGVELGRVDKYGNRYSRLYATNHITDGALAPDGTAVAATFDVGVLADGTRYLNTSAGWYCNVYPTVNNTRTLGTSSLRWKECYSNAYYLGTTAFGDIVTHNASEFLTEHPSITLSSNTTSTASPAHGGTFTCIDSVTQDTNGHITKVNTKTVTLPSDNNTDTKVKQYEGTTNNERPILSRYNSTEASQTANFVVYDTGVTSNPAKHTITASGGFIGKLSGVPTGNTYVSAVKDGGALVNSQATSWGAIWRAPTKDYQVAGATWSNTNNNVYICYSVTNANAEAGTNTMAKSLIWAADTGTLTTTTFSGALSGNASSATEFSANTTVALTGDATGTSAGSKKGWSVPVTLANSGVTAGDYGPSADASPAHSGTFTVPSITVDAKGRVTAASTKTITLPADNNTDTKVTQTVTTANSAYPVLLCATANATTTETTTSRFSAGLIVNARYSTIYMANKYNTANTKGVRNSTTSYLNGAIIFRCYDASEMGRIHCESNKNGYQQTYIMASNYIKNGAISPEGTATTCYITVRVRDNGSKTIYTDGSWENSLIPYANNTHSLGTSSLRWKGVYAVNFYENGTALSSKYALNENFGKGTTTYLYIKSADFPSGSGSATSIHYNDVVDGTKLYVWCSVCNSSSVLSTDPSAAHVTTVTGQVWRYLGPTIYAAGLGPQSANPTGILGLFRRES